MIKLLILVALLAGACGNGKKSGTTPTTGSGSAVTAPSTGSDAKPGDAETPATEEDPCAVPPP